MLVYWLSIFLAIAIFVALFFILRFIVRVGLDLCDLVMLMWDVRKNNAAYKKYLEEKAKNLEKERALRLKKFNDRQNELQEQNILDIGDIAGIYVEPPSPDQVWQSRIFRERFPFIRALKEILSNNAANFLKGGAIAKNGVLPIWQARVAAKAKEQEMYQQGRR